MIGPIHARRPRPQIARARQGIAVAEAAGIMQRWSIPVGAFAALLGVSER